MKRQPWVVHLDGDAFAVAVERRRGRAPAQGAVLVGHEAEGRGVVTCASYEARRAGVQAGCSLAWARWRLPQAVVVPPDGLAYEQAAREVWEFLQGEAPVVEMAGEDEFFLDLTGCDRWCGGDVGKWSFQLLQRLRAATGLEFSAGVASTKIVARLATRLGKPGGMTWVRPGAEEEFLRPLPLAAIPEIPRRMVALLAELGCRRVAQVVALGRDHLEGLFGAEGAWLWLALRGLWGEPVRPTVLAPAVEVEEHFEPDTCQPMMLAAGLRLALERLAWELRQRGQRCYRLIFTALYCDGMMTRRSALPSYPTNQTHELAAVARGWVEALLRRRVRVRRLHLRAITQCGGWDIADFFEEERLARTARLYEAVDRVRARYGLTSLVSAATLPALPRAKALDGDPRGASLRTPTNARGERGCGGLEKNFVGKGRYR